jgi:hypothetical protein
LEILEIDNNRLTELDLSNNPLVWKVICTDNELTELDFGKNTELHILHCKNNPIKRLCINSCVWDADFRFTDRFVEDISEGEDRTRDVFDIMEKFYRSKLGDSFFDNREAIVSDGSEMNHPDS